MRDAGKISDICIGLVVEIDTKEGLKQGSIIEIITKRDNPKGIKVKIDTGDVGRIKKIIAEPKVQQDGKTIPYLITAKIYKAIYCKKIEDNIQGETIFKVNAESIDVALYKVNKFLTKLCADTDVKYEVIKVESGT